ncbi:MAG: AAA family ATPase [Victivallales bacterium]
MKRKIDKYLDDWRISKNRKPLLIRGARQVGKTYSVRELGKKFEHYLEVNFEEEKDIRKIFEGSLNPEMIAEKLSAFYKVPVIPGETLLFLDEIQSCPQAISSLRFFYEKKPELHIIAAGSLLEFALESLPSLGVGRLSSLFMFPMSFHEFLNSVGDDALAKAVLASDFNTPLETAFHNRLIDRLRTFFIIGGMPEVVQNYIRTGELLKCQNILDQLLTTFIDDFAKYKKRAPVARLEEVFRAISFQAGKKFKFSKVNPVVSSAVLKDALELLVKAGLAYKIHHSSAQGIPLGAQIDPKKFKVALFDIGMHQRLLGLDLSNIIVADDLDSINAGNIAEIFTALEILSYSNPETRNQLFYWHRESKSSNAEVDYIIQKGRQIIPLEVKAGTKGQMQSMRQFMSERDSEYGLRISLENFSCFEKIKVLPLYAIYKLFEQE